MSTTIEGIRVSPGWFTATRKNLKLIQKNIADYCDEGNIAPDGAVFLAVESFLDYLKNHLAEINIEEPKLFVSPNGHMVLTWGNKTKSMDIRFATTDMAFFFKEPDKVAKGRTPKEALTLLRQYFRV